MFILRTGLQGNGKTLNTIKEVDTKAAKEGRVVYYHNVTGFKPDAKILQAEWIEFADPEKWYELPLNAMIVIDEAQKFFRIRPQGTAVPEYAAALETMRKQGHELHCITQNPKLIDVHFRNLCNGHIHYVRGHQGKVIKRWRFESPVNVDSEKNFERFGEATRITIDKRYFGCYESIQGEAEHHFKFRPPRALFVFIGLCLLIAVGGWYIYDKRINPDAAEPVAADLDVGTEFKPKQQLQNAAPEDYGALHKPRLTDVPSSAPIYDELTKPVSYPKLICAATNDVQFIGRMGGKIATDMHKGRLYGCRCNTQQGTRVTISFAGCMSYVESGAFDPAIADRAAAPDGQQTQTAGQSRLWQAGSASGGLPEARGSTPEGVSASTSSMTDAEYVQNTPARATYVNVVPDTEYPSRPWR